MGNKTLTSVEWLVSALQENEYIFFDGKPHDYSLIELIAEAKQLEKKQHEISFSKGFRLRSYIHDSVYGGVEYWSETPKKFEDYYTETYGEQA